MIETRVQDIIQWFGMWEYDDNGILNITKRTKYWKFSTEISSEVVR